MTAIVMAFVAAGVLSVPNHVTGSWVGFVLAGVALLPVTATALGISLLRLTRGWPGWPVAACVVAVLGSAAAGLWMRQIPGLTTTANAAFAVLAVLVAVVEVPILLRGYRRHGPSQEFLAGGAAWVVLLVGTIAWGMGNRTSELCRPGSLLQWHGVWHLALAAAGFLYYRHVTAEGRADSAAL